MTRTGEAIIEVEAIEIPALAVAPTVPAAAALHRRLDDGGSHPRCPRAGCGHRRGRLAHPANVSGTMRLRARHYRTGERIDVVCAGPSIASVGPTGAEPADIESPWIAPALCDVQINGALGKSFTAVRTVAEFHGIVDVCREHGISELCPTLITASADDLIRGFTFLAHACETDAALRRAVVGYHLEGPYIAAEDGPRSASAVACPASRLGRIPPLPGRRRGPDRHGDAGAGVAGRWR